MITPQPFIYLAGKKIASFTLLGSLGLFLSLCTTLLLTYFLDLSIQVWLGLALIGIIVFFGLAEIMNRIKGTPVLVYYHHELAVVLLSSGFLLFTKSGHILSYLDIVATGLGIVLTFGRIGCFMAGCCHGKPASFGIHYHKEHAEMGFPYYYLHTRLFPVQLLEALGVTFIVIFMLIVIQLKFAPGTAFGIYILGYGLLRFLLEFARGDIARPYYGPLSEAQWFSVVFAILLLVISLAGGFPGFFWHVAVIIFILAVFAFLILSEKFSKPWMKIKHYQIRRLAILINELNVECNKDVRLKIGKNTILVTAGILEEEDMTVKHFTVSMYPLAKAEWLDFIGNLIYSLQNHSGVLTKLNQSTIMRHFIIKSQKNISAPKAIHDF